MWEKYRKIGLQEMRPYVPGEDLAGVSVSERDTPEDGGMIARGADDGALWYVSKRFFNENYRAYWECDCDGAKFIEHIKKHLHVGQDVICKICGKTPTEIANLSLDQTARKSGIESDRATGSIECFTTGCGECGAEACWNRRH